MILRGKLFHAKNRLSLPPDDPAPKIGDKEGQDAISLSNSPPENAFVKDYMPRISEEDQTKKSKRDRWT